MNLNDNRLIIKTLKSGDQKVFSLVYVAKIFLIYQCQEQGIEFNHPFPYYPSGI